MVDQKFCIDIGGTKTIFALVNQRLDIIKSEILPTPKDRKDFIKFIRDNSAKYKGLSDDVFISIAGRFDKKGRIIMAPNLPAVGLNMRKIAANGFRKVYIENDGNCFGLYSLYRGKLNGVKNGIALVWGTGIGGAVVSDGKIMRGNGTASELGHIALFDRDSGDIESLIGGKAMKAKYGVDGEALHMLAEKGDLSAIKAFQDIGRVFGRYLSSLSYLFDPEVIVVGGSFANSWKFIKKSAYSQIRTGTIRHSMNIKIEKGKYNVIKGCYFLGRT